MKEMNEEVFRDSSVVRVLIFVALEATRLAWRFWL